jgi:7,8-dihydropterin-6-yl-methyl-4-(beta-D-ribofuranosyl)aminobenzene 5'-phosphate synthase
VLTFLLAGIMVLGGALGDEVSPVRLTVLYDDDAVVEGAWVDHGFSCLVENTSGTVLFDTGGRGSILEHNLDALELDLAGVDAVVISHSHPDHVGGLAYVLERLPGVKLYIPSDCPDDIVSLAERAGAEVIRVSVPVEIIPGIWTTGEVEGTICEQGLVVDTPRGPMVVVGGSHPGLTTFARCAANVAQRAPYMVLGGFHLAEGSAGRIDTVVRDLRDLEVQRVAPSHSAGVAASDELRRKLGDAYVEIGVGTQVVLSG